MNTNANFPAGSPIDAAGNLMPQWRLFFLALFERSGGESGNNTAALQASLKKANANIADLQTESADGDVTPDVGAIYGVIYAVEAISAQAAANASQLIRKIADLEARIDEMAQPSAQAADELRALQADGASNSIAALLPGNNLSDVQSASTALATLGGAALTGAAFTGGSSFTANSAPLTLTNSGGGSFQLLLSTAGVAFPGRIGVSPAGVITVSNNNAINLTLDGSGNLTLLGGLAFAPPTSTTSPAAGGAGALPATPAGYASVTIGGTARKIAYY